MISYGRPTETIVLAGNERQGEVTCCKTVGSAYAGSRPTPAASQTGSAEPLAQQEEVCRIVLVDVRGGSLPAEEPALGGGDVEVLVESRNPVSLFMVAKGPG
ncbi:hypothetical protein Psi02_55310 [Planotetraspora silvatica]|uniref:Uncharacterized protein n=1 Tax=Planotetraspora silvatica TaxID=234614 RepID=A0A8J3USQ8_9ACTN|nr:hypothetical protein Psi02_55310 [Planotetraspora silvatica]